MSDLRETAVFYRFTAVYGPSWLTWGLMLYIGAKADEKTEGEKNEIEKK